MISGPFSTTRYQSTLNWASSGSRREAAPGRRSSVFRSSRWRVSLQARSANLNHPRAILFILLLVALAAAPADAFDAAQLKQLQETRSCTHCDLSEAKLERQELRNVNLAGANLRGASLAGTDFLGANLEGANLWHAKLAGADLWNASHISSLIGLNVRPSTAMVLPLSDPPNAADTFRAMARLRISFATITASTMRRDTARS
jgi:uncharacterized protein YjbI with pentapeptide repeats